MKTNKKKVIRIQNISKTTSKSSTNVIVWPKTSWAYRLLNLKKVCPLIEYRYLLDLHDVCVALCRTAIAVIWFSFIVTYVWFVFVCWFLFCVYFPFARAWFSVFCRQYTWNTFFQYRSGRFSTKLWCNWESKLVEGTLWWNHHTKRPIRIRIWKLNR